MKFLKNYKVAVIIVVAAIIAAVFTVVYWKNSTNSPSEFIGGPSIGPTVSPNQSVSSSVSNTGSPSSTSKVSSSSQPAASQTTYNNQTTAASSSTFTPNSSDIIPVLYLPYSTISNLPSSLVPMGETIYHAKPQNPTGHGGIDFQWETPISIPTIIASMDATVTAIINSTSHIGTFDVTTKNGKWGVDYAEMASVKSGLEVGDSVKVGDEIGTPQHPSSITDFPNFRMIHWQFGYAGEAGVGERLCPMQYFTSDAKTAIESLWANTNSPNLKANAPDICSGDYAM